MEQDDVEISPEALEASRRRAEHLPSRAHEIEAMLESMPLTATHMPADGKASEEFEAIQALLKDESPEERAQNLKETGNETFALAKRQKEPALRNARYHDALGYYTSGLDVGCANQELNATILSNRAQVQMLLGNYGRAVADCQDAIARHPKNIKAYYRAAEASVHLHKHKDAADFSEAGLAACPADQASAADATVLSALRKLLVEARRLLDEERRVKEEREAKQKQLRSIVPNTNATGGSPCLLYVSSSLQRHSFLATATNSVLQVAAGVIGGLLWAIENPHEGICEPEDLDHEFILRVARPYLGRLGGTHCVWRPPPPFLPPPEKPQPKHVLQEAKVNNPAFPASVAASEPKPSRISPHHEDLQLERFLTVPV